MYYEKTERRTEMPQKSGLKKNLFLSTFYQVLKMVLPLITAPYAARVLGVDGTGIYSYTHAYVTYFMLFGALGMVSYGGREIARHRNNKDERSQIFWEIAILTFITTTISLLAWGIWILFNREYRIYYIILTFYLVGTMFDISWLYGGMEEFKYTVTQNSLFKILGTISIFVFVKKAEDLWIYILIMSLTACLANISMWIYLPKFVNKVPLKGIRLKKHLKETFIYFIPTIAISVYTILDKTLIGLITQDTSENGNYEQATKIVNMAKSVCFAGVNAVLHSRISYLFTEKKYEEIKQRIAASMDYILFIGIGICFGIIGVAQRFVPLYFGPGYEATILLLQLMSPLIIIVGISNCLGDQYYNPAGLRAQSAKYIITGSVINLILNLIFIPRLKSTGAVIATLIAETVISVLYFSNCSGYYRLNVFIRQISRKLFAGIVMMIVVLLLGSAIDNAFVSVIVQILTGGIVYCVSLLLMKDSFMTDVVILNLKKLIKK